MSGSNLLHLNPDMESSRKVFDELSEVNAFISNIIEDCLVAITLIFHVTNFHLQPQSLCNLPAFNHGLVLSCLCLMVFIHVGLFGNPVYPLDVVG